MSRQTLLSSIAIAGAISALLAFEYGTAVRAAGSPTCFRCAMRASPLTRTARSQLVPSERGRRGFEARGPGRTQAAAPIGEGSR